MKDNKDSLYTIDKSIEDIKYAFDELKDVIIINYQKGINL